MPRGSPPISLEQLQPYYRGVHFCTVALKGRLEKLGPDGRKAIEVLSRYQSMVAEYQEAIQKTVESKQGD
jgi:archaellum biogenesis ATPase FlaH